MEDIPAWAAWSRGRWSQVQQQQQVLQQQQTTGSASCMNEQMSAHERACINERQCMRQGRRLVRAIIVMAALSARLFKRSCADYVEPECLGDGRGAPCAALQSKKLEHEKKSDGWPMSKLSAVAIAVAIIAAGPTQSIGSRNIMRE